jgi:Putative prokaryotic signal transducing protein
MAQDPERDEEQPESGAVNPSHDLDMVPLYSSQTIEAASEAEVLRGILDANGIPTVMTNEAPGFPNLGYVITVPRDRIADARRVIAEQQAAGPEAAAEAEAQSEE